MKNKKTDGKKKRVISVEMPIRMIEMIDYLKSKGYGKSYSEVVRNVVHNFLGVFRYGRSEETETI